MKKIVFLLLVALQSCSSFSQKKEGRLIVDSTLHNAFFDVPEYIVEGTDSLFTDSVLVRVNNSTDTIDDRGRCDINEVNKRHFPFSYCKGYILNDTLAIEFYNKSNVIPDEFTLKVIGNKFYSFFHFTETKQIDSADPENLIIKNKVYKKGKKSLEN